VCQVSYNNPPVTLRLRRAYSRGDRVEWQPPEEAVLNIPSLGGMKPRKDDIVSGRVRQGAREYSIREDYEQIAQLVNTGVLARETPDAEKERERLVAPLSNNPEVRQTGRCRVGVMSRETLRSLSDRELCKLMPDVLVVPAERDGDGKPLVSPQLAYLRSLEDVFEFRILPRDHPMDANGASQLPTLFRFLLTQVYSVPSGRLLGGLPSP
jgi:hypothetical protein